MRQTIWLTVCLLLSNHAQAQILTGKEQKIDSMILSQIDQYAIIPVHSLLTNTAWMSSDVLGTRKISFSKDKFKQVKDGSRGQVGKINGSWSIYDQYIVLDVKNEKTSFYMIKYQNEIILIDSESIDIARRLLMEMIVNDQWMGEMTAEEIFGFLTGYKKAS